ncbi:MAG: sigma factor G inhibitor Gin [Clostridia bacterium]|nr:sigma factor G inhibitor Gin [Clostridia bacterium]
MEEKVVSINQKVLPICFLCNTVPQEGIRRGFFLKGIFICGQCEDELISCDINNTEKYKLALEKLREILFKKSPRIF